jgi:hypothetical protein
MLRTAEVDFSFVVQPGTPSLQESFIEDEIGDF